MRPFLTRVCLSEGLHAYIQYHTVRNKKTTLYQPFFCCYTANRFTNSLLNGLLSEVCLFTINQLMFLVHWTI